MNYKEKLKSICKKRDESLTKEEYLNGLTYEKKEVQFLNDLLQLSSEIDFDTEKSDIKCTYSYLEDFFEEGKCGKLLEKVVNAKMKIEEDFPELILEMSED